MASMNKVFIIGNLTRDPELRYIPSGTAVADLRLAVNRKFRSASGEDKEDTCFVDVVVWDKQAQNCSEYLSKGSPLLVEGRLQMDEWEKDGQKYNKLRVVAERTQFLSSPRRGEFRDGPADAAPSSRSAAPAPSRGGPAAAAARTGVSPAAAEGEIDDLPGDDDNLPF